ncbi:DUF6182 family protein [Actinoplanes sp. NPDC051346]|uniref:DUF6182 family protein n=1 Tax=Actinoplanes sp. NPDC051346 TaxID=3155048 RepID=UPI00341BF633
MATQDYLAAVLRERLTRAGIDAARLESVTEPERDCTAVAVLRRFEITTFAESALRFAANVSVEQGADWLAALTRTAFLAGNPANLRGRFPPAYLAPDESIAWYGPAPSSDYTGLRRLLKAFPAGNLQAPTRMLIPACADGKAGPRSCRLRLATAGLTTASYLVHLNHTLAEAVLDGLLRADDPLVIDHVPELTDADLRTAARIRVHRDTADPACLRAYTCLYVR